MARFASPRPGPFNARLGVLLRTVALATVLLLPVAVVAGWFERIVGSAVRSGPLIPPALENAVRHVRGLPAKDDVVALAYGLLVVLGLLGVPISRTWWQRVWPPESAGEYAGRTGYWAARATRGLAFSLVFVPLTALVSAPYNLGRQVQEAVTAPVRLLRRLTRPVPSREGPVGRASGPVPGASAAATREYAGEGAPRAAATPRERGDDRPRFLSGR